MASLDEPAVEIFKTQIFKGTHIWGYNNHYKIFIF